MNITDIDDKIIIKARKDHLLKEYVKEEKSLETIMADINEAVKLTEEKLNEEQDKDKKEMYARLLAKAKVALEKITAHTNSTILLHSSAEIQEFLDSSSDILATWLDKKYGKNVTDNSIFSKLPRYYEGEFHKDMAALNVTLLLFLIVQKKI